MLRKSSIILKSFANRVKRHFNLLMYPRYINFICTYKCNSKCKMCGIWRRKDKKELSFDQIEMFFTANKNFLNKVVHIGLTGGEPTMRGDLVRIIATIRTYNIETGFQTNGFESEKIRDIVQEILKFYPNFSISISLDGSPEVHDEMRGIKGAYERAIQTIKYMKELEVKSITCGMTITSYNYDQIYETKKLVESLGCVFSCCLMDKSWYFANEHSNMETPLPKLSFPDNYYMDNIGKNKKFKCYGGYTTLTIDPYGNVYPCIMREDIFGNIRIETLKEMLYNERSGMLKEWLKLCKGCWSQCEVTTSVSTDCLDVLKWFMFDCKDRRGFLRGI